ncbi:FAD-linked oxidase C-terminal domain-containing protein, partial [Acinetobacter baumannii]
VCVPISYLAECVLETEQDVKSLGLIAPIVGHAGDGNFHTQPVFDRTNPEEVARVETFLKRLSERAIRMEGTCTGEHGVGQGKMKYLKA